MKNSERNILITLSGSWLTVYILSFILASDWIMLPLILLSIGLGFFGTYNLRKLPYVVAGLLFLIAVEWFLLWYPYMEFMRIDARMVSFIITLAMAIIGRYLFTSIQIIGTGFLIMLGLFILGVTFKKLHWPGAGVLLVISITAISLMYLFTMFYSFSFLKTNKLLFVSTFFCSLIITHFFLGWLFKAQHWPGAGFFYYNTINYFHIAFVLCSALLIVGVQLTNFSHWIESQRIFLVKNLLIPWFVVFLFSAWFFLFRDSFESIFVDKSHWTPNPWGMVDYEIPVN